MVRGRLRYDRRMGVSEGGRQKAAWWQNLRRRLILRLSVGERSRKNVPFASWWYLLPSFGIPSHGTLGLCNVRLQHVWGYGVLGFWYKCRPLSAGNIFRRSYTIIRSWWDNSYRKWLSLCVVPFFATAFFRINTHIAAQSAFTDSQTATLDAVGGERDRKVTNYLIFWSGGISEDCRQ